MGRANTNIKSSSESAAPSPAQTAGNRFVFDSVIESLARFGIATVNGAASPTLAPEGIDLDKGSSSNGGVSLELLGQSDIMNKWDKNPEFWFEAVEQGGSPDSNTWDWFITFGRGGTHNTAVTTAQHMGFLFRNTGGTLTVHATNADGTTQTLSPNVLGTQSEFSLHSFYVKMTSGEKIEFYMNGEIVATHTTNLPSGSIGSIPLFSTAVRSTVGTATTQNRISRFGFSYNLSAPILPTYQGEYNAGTTYDSGDVVTYGGPYTSTQDENTGNTPGTNSTWAPGQLEAGSPNPAYKGGYNPGTVYQVGDIVTYETVNYTSNQAGNLSHDPPNPGWWDVGGSATI